MKSMRVVYNDNKKLDILINEVYYSNDNNGKIPSEFTQRLKIESSTLKTILSDLEGYDIKIENKDVIDGNMKFKTKEIGEDLYLIPTSIYCIKKKETYSFY